MIAAMGTVADLNVLGYGQLQRRYARLQAGHLCEAPTWEARVSCLQLNLVAEMLRGYCVEAMQHEADEHPSTAVRCMYPIL